MSFTQLFGPIYSTQFFVGCGNQLVTQLIALCALQQFSGVNLINVYGVGLLKSEELVLIHGGINFVASFVCFAIVDSHHPSHLIVVGRKKLLLVGVCIITVCLVMIQLLAWVDKDHQNANVSSGQKEVADIRGILRSVHRGVWLLLRPHFVTCKTKP